MVETSTKLLLKQPSPFRTTIYYLFFTLSGANHLALVLKSTFLVFCMLSRYLEMLLKFLAYL